MIFTCEEHADAVVVHTVGYNRCPICREIGMEDDLKQQVNELESELDAREATILELEAAARAMQAQVRELEAAQA